MHCSPLHPPRAWEKGTRGSVTLRHPSPFRSLSKSHCGYHRPVCPRISDSVPLTAPLQPPTPSPPVGEPARCWDEPQYLRRAAPGLGRQQKGWHSVWHFLSQGSGAANTAYGPSNMASMPSHWFHTLPSLALDHWGFACPRALAYARNPALV